MYFQMKSIAVLPILVPVIFAGYAPKVAIIGSGIGGTSCAYFLKQLFKENITLAIFERDTVGGRLATLEVDENYYESGGSIIHPRNQYMKGFAKLLGLKECPEASDSRWGIYNGKEFVFEESRWRLSTLVRFIWKYGFDLFRMTSVISSLLNDFDRIYLAQEEKLAFTTVQDLLQHMSPSFPLMTQTTLKSFMENRSFSDKFINDFAEAVMLVNYGQTTSLNSFAGAVSLAGAESGLWSIKGGNRLLPRGLLKESGATLIEAEVMKLILNASNFTLQYKDKASHKIITDDYDIVIVAAPLRSENPDIVFENFDEDFDKYRGPYHQTVATFVQGIFKPSAFDTCDHLDAILTNNNSFIFNSLGKVIPVTGEEPSHKKSVYKIFSKVPVTKAQLDFLFDDIENVQIKQWMAYPHYAPPEKLPPFLLHENLYYTNAIEWSASAMEMSAIAGKNVALLIYNSHRDDVFSIDSNPDDEHEEL